MTARRILSEAEVIRRLRALTPPRPLSVTRLAAVTGLSRESIYQARAGYVPDRVRELLSEVLLGDCQDLGGETTPVSVAPEQRPTYRR